MNGVKNNLQSSLIRSKKFTQSSLVYISISYEVHSKFTLSLVKFTKHVFLMKSELLCLKSELQVNFEGGKVNFVFPLLSRWSELVNFVAVKKACVVICDHKFQQIGNRRVHFSCNFIISTCGSPYFVIFLHMNHREGDCRQKLSEPYGLPSGFFPLLVFLEVF